VSRNGGEFELHGILTYTSMILWHNASIVCPDGHDRMSESVLGVCIVALCSG